MLSLLCVLLCATTTTALTSPQQVVVIKLVVPHSIDELIYLRGLRKEALSREVIERGEFGGNVEGDNQQMETNDVHDDSETHEDKEESLQIQSELQAAVRPSAKELLHCITFGVHRISCDAGMEGIEEDNGDSMRMRMHLNDADASENPLGMDFGYIFDASSSLASTATVPQAVSSSSPMDMDTSEDLLAGAS